MAESGFDLHRAIGGTAGCRKLATVFYARVGQDPLLRPFFPGKTMKCAIEAFAAYLAQLFGGPAKDAQRRWWLSLRESHLRFNIGPAETAAWMNNMAGALADVQMEEPVRAALREFFDQASAYLVNTEGASTEAGKPIEPLNGVIPEEIARRWNAQRELDETVAAVRSGDAERAIMLAGSSTLQSCYHRNRSVLAGLLGVMMDSSNDEMLRYVQKRIVADPALVQERYRGRTLLHEASANCILPVVKLLLQLGADPNAPDGGSHTPLYCLANQCTNSRAGDVVRTLVESGAHVNACGGVKRCTALHMAARRGNVEVAGALLDCGADIEAQDSLGETPLRRSVNCDKTQVAALLLKRGADVHSKGSKGLTPLSAARSGGMKRLLGRLPAPTRNAAE